MNLRSKIFALLICLSACAVAEAQLRFVPPRRGRNDAKPRTNVIYPPLQKRDRAASPAPRGDVSTTGEAPLDAAKRAGPPTHRRAPERNRDSSAEGRDGMHYVKIRRYYWERRQTNGWNPFAEPEYEYRRVPEERWELIDEQEYARLRSAASARVARTRGDGVDQSGVYRGRGATRPSRSRYAGGWRPRSPAVRADERDPLSRIALPPTTNRRR